MGREVKRVPVDFDWPLKQVWGGFLMPDALREKACPTCRERPSWVGHEPNGDGLTPEARAIANTFYPHQIGGPNAEALAWHDKIGQVELDYLIENMRIGRSTLYDRIELKPPYEKSEYGYDIRFEWVRNDNPAPTVAEVNAVQRSRRRLMSDWSFQSHDLIGFRCERLGITVECPDCDGHGTQEKYAGQRDDAEAWERTEPPEGDGWQLWETTSEGSPVGPVFATAEELAAWLGTHEGGSAVGFGHSCEPMPYEQALAFVGVGSSPSMIGDGGGLHDGAAWVGSQAILSAHEKD